MAYNFADGEVPSHPMGLDQDHPGRGDRRAKRSSAAALRQGIGKLADSPDLVRVADLATRAAVSVPTEGRALYAGLGRRPNDPVARLWHAATLLRENRG